MGWVINPVTNEKSEIISLHQGRVLGMALDQFVLPGFAAYHIGIREPNALKLLTEQDSDTEEALDGLVVEVVEALESPSKENLIQETEGFDD